MREGYWPDVVINLVLDIIVVLGGFILAGWTARLRISPRTKSLLAPLVLAICVVFVVVMGAPGYVYLFIGDAQKDCRMAVPYWETSAQFSGMWLAHLRIGDCWNTGVYSSDYVSCLMTS